MVFSIITCSSIMNNYDLWVGQVYRKSIKYFSAIEIIVDRLLVQFIQLLFCL